MWCTFDRSQDDELSGDGGATGKMHMPNRIVILPDKSAFISVETQMNRIQKFDPYTFDWLGDMSAATTTSHTPPTGSGDGEFNSPQDIVMRPDGTEAYVVDKGNSRITVIDPQAWTVLRQIPVTSDALAPDIDMNACVAAAYDSVGDRLILLMSAYGYPNYNSAFAIVPVDGGTQSNYPLAGVEYVQVEVSADGSRVYLFRKKSAQILDATFNEISGGTYGTDTADCRNGFGNVGFGPGATTIDEEGYLWVGDGSCRRHIQFDVTGDAWSVKTWIGHSDDFVGTSPMMRPDGMLLLFNRDSDTNAMTTRCRNPQMADGTPWRSATVRRNRQRRR
jgi:YVTN family beta-propeller protein